jgi:hypothetical protein
VLVVGGSRGKSSIASCIYDPETKTWTEAPAPAHTRSLHNAMLTADGCVFIAGGMAKDPVRLAEIFDPDSGTWSAAGTIGSDRFWPTLVAHGGKILLFGGGEPLDPSTDVQLERWNGKKWSAGPATPQQFLHHDGVQLPSGDVLLLPGSVPPGLALALWEVATSTWRAAGKLSVTRAFGTATVLSDGRVLVVGGTEGRKTHASCELWDPKRRRCKPTGELANPRVGHRATLLADGRVLVTGGQSSSFPAVFPASCEVWDPATGVWSSAGELAKPITEHAATLLDSGEVLVTGGQAGGPPIKAAQLWRPD